MTKLCVDANIKASSSGYLNEGEMSAVHDLDSHQVSNLEGPQQNLLTVHIYSLPQVNINIYNLVNNQISKAVFVDLYS